ncbi:bifunctional precorrin-2 dehydrogenase/sirohydrochlorin ferrochelatase [Parabacteroides sp. FAFU027]|uniref:precorrin-2 dehydrogenase/sirohydrochlorin ferrochelatase family protein n=1 Tax=Parabacteroides sp. FAFU027 TaxID=2922715 RepID=UPI001FB03EC4|nr:bifunctional precorrin-2 dehydrogenase/sirohydrochlorin ferrochelatase [Parabacteroides sp. FAFU027]
MNKSDLQFLPISINVTGKKILMIGGGKVASHKAEIMARFVTNVTVIAPEISDKIRTLPFEIIEKEYESSDLDGYFLVYVVTDNHELNRKIKQDCEERGILASVCDAPLLCDFVSPAIHKEEHITVSVGSNAQNVYQSVDIRNQIRELFENGTIKIKE